MRQRVLRSLVLAAVVLPVLGAGTATAQSCPNKSTTTVTVKDSNGKPLYTYLYTRGCIVSYDQQQNGGAGTNIVYNLFEPTSRGPFYTILEGPGWGGAGATSPDGNLIEQGYAELTWDPRGFGQSGGVAEVDAPYAEGRDVSALIDKVLTGRLEIATDQCGDNGQPDQPDYSADKSGPNVCGQPAVGMTGGSYGGGIQFATAAFDNRVKTIVPVITWNDLNYSLWPNNVIKTGWGELLYGAGLAEQAAEHGQADVNTAALTSGQPNPFSGGDGGMQVGGYDPMIHYSEVTGASLGYPDRTTKSWFSQRSQAFYGAGSSGHIADVPTLLEQGTVDTLFNLNDAWANYLEISGRYPELPVKMIAFCGGHVSCPTGAAPTGIGYSATASPSSPVGAGETAGQFDENQMLAWFNHYLRGQGANDGMPKDANVVYQDQTGNFRALQTFPTRTTKGPATYVPTSFNATLVSTGATTGASPAAGTDSAVTDGATASGDPEQTTIPVVTPRAHADPIVGIGHVDATVTLNGAPTELFFRLIDKNSGDVVDLQTVPMRVDPFDLQGLGTGGSVPPAVQTISVDLAGVAYDLPAGDELDLQVSTATDSFSGNRGPSVVQISGTASVPQLAP